MVVRLSRISTSDDNGEYEGLKPQLFATYRYLEDCSAAIFGSAFPQVHPSAARHPGSQERGCR